jgi:flagellar export protein FliJ
MRRGNSVPQKLVSPVTTQSGFTAAPTHLNPKTIKIMKPFRFPLQSLRTLREQKERKAQQAFAEAMRACEECAVQLQTASDELAAGWSAFCKDLSTGVTANKLVRTRGWCDVLEARQRDRAAALQEARRTMSTAMREMMLATQAREAIDLHHSKSRQAHDRDVQRAEQKILDEIGVTRAFAARAALVLSVLEGYTHAEIGHILSVLQRP